jgi:hypothetical protein
MADTSGNGWVALVGLLGGGIVAGWWFFWPASEPSPWQQAAIQSRASMQRVVKQPEPPQSSPAPENQADLNRAALASATPVPAGPCSFAPALAPSGPHDGLFSLDSALATRQLSTPRAFISVAKEAASHRRVHDTEVALIVACRLAGETSPRSVVLADAQASLGQLYVQYAPAPGDQARSELLERAQQLLGDSARAYRAILGRNASKTQVAMQRLDAVAKAQALSATADEVIADEAPTEGAAGAGPTAMLSRGETAADRQGRRAQAAEAEAARSSAATPPKCAGLGSAAGRIVCSDPELAQIDSDLQRLASQAGSVTADPEGFRKRVEQAQARRDSSCQDKACLMRWYAQRKRELLNEF